MLQTSVAGVLVAAVSAGLLAMLWHERWNWQGRMLMNYSKPTIAMVNGWCFGGAFTPLMYLPARVWSQQNQASKFKTGVLHILAAHSGPETAADAVRACV